MADDVSRERSRSPPGAAAMQGPDQYDHAHKAETTLGIVSLSESCGNSGDELAQGRTASAKLIWYIRHGQSTWNVAKQAAIAKDKAAGNSKNEELLKSISDCSYYDCPLTVLGKEEAAVTARLVNEWMVQPKLVVASPLTRALQTAALVFQKGFQDGSMRLAVRPELREYFASSPDAKGRPLSELQACRQLMSLAAWPAISTALGEAETCEWAALWDIEWACGATAARHIDAPRRHESFNKWMLAQPEAEIAIVSHWGTINNFLNREPWADELPRQALPPGSHWVAEAWPPGGLARMLDLRNAGWIATISLARKGD